VETIETFKNVEQSLLRHFLGVFAVAAHQPAVVKNLGAEMFHKAIKCFWFSSNQSSGEFNFRLSVQGRVPLLIVAGSECRGRVLLPKMQALEKGGARRHLGPPSAS
jgi:hypothetical protein